MLLKHRTNTSAPIITEKLRSGKNVPLTGDFLRTDDIIGKLFREVVGSRKKVLYRIHRPSLAEYTDNSPRLVTPIYSQDASLIVSLLDLNPTLPRADSADKARFEIFEAGTGHGALTLHLARGIHAANTAPPEMPELVSELEESEVGYRRLKLDIEDTSDEAHREKAQKEQVKAAFDEWRSTRRAVIHTLDINEKHSAHAQKVVKNFRNGLYYGHVDFHVGTVEEYLSGRLSESGQQPFLEHAILDLPGTQGYLDIVAKALKPGGSLLVFCPSVTQIIECIKDVKENKLPLFMEKTVEMGGAIGVGGREWDVRPVKPRALQKSEVLEAGLETADKGWEMICRPKVGVRIAGGGFVGQFQRTVDFPARLERTVPITPPSFVGGPNKTL